MLRVEGWPFNGRWSKIGNGPTADSVVGKLLWYKKETDIVIKWNRETTKKVSSPQEGLQICLFIMKSLALYKATLGKAHIVPTYPVLGEKMDKGRKKIKIYLVQPFIECWDGKTLPDGIKYDGSFLNQWQDLSDRLTQLYAIAREVNRPYFPNSPRRFPLTLTLGWLRRASLDGISIQLPPETPNLLIEKRTCRILLCDFGSYVPWQEEMNEAYEKILGNITHRLKCCKV